MTRKQEKPRHSLHHSGCRGFLSFLYMLFGFCQCKTSSSACLGSACLLQTRVRGIPPTLGWGKQSTWLAASGSLAHLRARPAPTPGREVDTTGRPLSRPCRPCVPLSGRGRVNTQGSPISGGVFSTCGRCFLKSRQAECSHENSEKERLRGSPVSGPLGAFDFRTRIKDRRR